MTLTNPTQNIQLYYLYLTISTPFIYINKIIIRTPSKPIQIYSLVNELTHSHSSLVPLSPTDALHVTTLYTDSLITNATSVTITHINNAHQKLSINPYNSTVKKSKIYGHVIVVNHVLSVYSHSKIKPYPAPNATLTYIKSVLNSNYNKT